MSIKGEQQARLTALHIRLQAFESILGYEERPLHRAVMTPKSYGTSGRIKEFGLGSGSSASARRLFTVLKSALGEARRSECS